MVRLKAKATVSALTKVFEDMFTRMESGDQQGGFLEGADDEIDALFD